MTKTIFRNTSLAALAVAVCGIAFLVLKNKIISSNPAGIVVQVLAVGLMLWARVVFGKRSFHAGANPTEGGLVTHGPYRFLRHPIYAAIIYFVWAGVVSDPSAEAIAAAVVVALCLIIRMLLEEHFLVAAYPEYKEYSRRAKRLIPFLL